MNKLIFILLFTICSFVGYGQKINQYRYNKVVTLTQYGNATVIVYNDKNGKQISDTLWDKDRKKGLTIKEAENVIILDQNIKPKKP